MGKGAPESDPNIGKAALLSAQTGQDYLGFMKGQAEVANKWAAEDRTRYTTQFRPLEDKFVADAQTYDSPERLNAGANEASADVRLATDQQIGQMTRQMGAMGVNPASGRFINTTGKMRMGAGLAEAGSRNLARRQIRAIGDSKRAEAINLGKGMAVNPATSLGLANGAASTGFNGAMQGYGQQGNLLNQDYQNRMAAWQANQSVLGGIGGAIGSIVGAIPWSSKKLKRNKRPARDLTKAVKKLNIEHWDYKEGVGDSGHHVGPYAEDFTKATGLGDGITINPIDAVGVTMGAVKEIANKVDRIERKIRMIAA